MAELYTATLGNKPVFEGYTNALLETQLACVLLKVYKCTSQTEARGTVSIVYFDNLFCPNNTLYLEVYGFIHDKAIKIYTVLSW